MRSGGWFRSRVRLRWPGPHRKQKLLALEKKFGPGYCRRMHDPPLITTIAAAFTAVLTVVLLVLIPVLGENSGTDAVSNAGMVLALAATARDQAIRELVAALPARKLPPGYDRTEIVELVLAREEEFSTDLGNGIAIPHARCSGLTAPLVVLGRSPHGVVFSSDSSEVVRLLFLLITPAERPETQLALLGQLARIAGTDASRAALLHAASPADVLEILHRQSKSVTGKG